LTSFLLFFLRRYCKDVAAKVSIADAEWIVVVVVVLPSSCHARSSAHQHAFLSALSSQRVFLVGPIVFQSALVVLVFDLLLDLLQLIKYAFDEHIRGTAEPRVGEQVIRAHTFDPGEWAPEA
jgi:hypothetical protein